MQNPHAETLALNALAFLAAGAHAASRYAVEELGTLGGDITIAQRINDRGMVTGEATRHRGTGSSGVAFFAPEYWPMPWYLPRSEYWSTVYEQPVLEGRRPMVVVRIDQEASRAEACSAPTSPGNC